MAPQTRAQKRQREEPSKEEYEMMIGCQTVRIGQYRKKVRELEEAVSGEKEYSTILFELLQKERMKTTELLLKLQEKEDECDCPRASKEVPCSFCSSSSF